MRIKTLIVVSLFFIFIGVLHFFLVYKLEPGDLLDKSLQLKDVRISHDLEFSLEPQDCFLKIKLFKNTDADVPFSLYLNNKELGYERKKIKDNYIKFYFIIKEEFIKQKNNVFTLRFQSQLPEGVSINLSNFKRRFTKDMVLIPAGNNILKNKSLSFSVYSTVLVFLLWLILFFVSKISLRNKNVFKFSLFSFLPAMIINVLFLSPHLFGDSIIITNYFFWFILISTITCIFFVFLFKRLFLGFKYNLKKSRIKYFLFVIITFFGVFFAFYSICEIITRIYISHHNPVKIFKISDKEISFVLNPNAKLEFADSFVSINKDGYRGKLLAYNKKSDTHRILFLGDSMVFGFGLNEGETLPEQLSGIKNLTQKTEVLNFAVTGYNTHQEKILFKRNVLKYSPDILIIGFCLNDIGGNIYTPTNFNTLLDVGQFNYRYADFGFFDRVQYLLLRNSCFYQYILYKWRAVFKNKSNYSSLASKFMRGELDNKMIKSLGLFKDDILEIKDICENNKIKLIIIAYGDELQLDNPNLKWLQGWLEKFCNDNRIYFLDLLPVFEGLNKDEILIDQGHPSKLGNKILADYLYNFLKNKNLIG